MSSVPPAPDGGTSTAPYTAAGQRQGEFGSGRGYSAFLPLLLMTLTLLAWPAFQCYQLVNEKGALATHYANQQRQLDDSLKLRAALDYVSRETALLADKGNPNARLIVDELKKRGVTINQSAPSSEPPKVTK